jgi:hypothetical protein
MGAARVICAEPIGTAIALGPVCCLDLSCSGRHHARRLVLLTSGSFVASAGDQSGLRNRAAFPTSTASSNR